MATSSILVAFVRGDSARTHQPVLSVATISEVEDTVFFRNNIKINAVISRNSVGWDRVFFGR